MTFRSRAKQDRPLVTTHSMISPRLAGSALRALGPLCAGAFLLLAPLPAFAQGKLDAHYEASLAGLPVGRGTWTIDISDDQFSASAAGGTAGLLNTIAGGSGKGAAPLPTNYPASTTTSKKSETIHLVLANGNIKEFGIEPEPPVDGNRIPVTEAHRRGVFDPMTGSMLRVPANVE